jgi:hypothetical protein
MAVAQYVRMWFKAGAFAANDFVSQGFGAGARQGDLGVDTTTGKLYVCTVSNVTAGTATWALVGTQT